MTKRFFKFFGRVGFVLACVFLLGGMHSQTGHAQPTQGIASYYKHGKVTASGEPFDPKGLTAAHRSLPFGTKVLVTHLASQKSVIVKINDRGPFIRGRIIDLSYGAAQKIGLKESGIGKVALQILEIPKSRTR